jgi:hypothetical protein
VIGTHQHELPLTDQFPPTYTRPVVLVKIACAGCAATATVPTLKRPNTFGVNAAGWSFCWEDENGELFRWCAQCVFEGRHERQPVWMPR